MLREIFRQFPNRIRTMYSQDSRLEYFLRAAKSSQDGIPKDTMLVRFKRTLSSEEREYFKLRIRNILNSDTIFVFDVA